MQLQKLDVNENFAGIQNWQGIQNLVCQKTLIRCPSAVLDFPVTWVSRLSSHKLTGQALALDGSAMGQQRGDSGCSLEFQA